MSAAANVTATAQAPPNIRRRTRQALYATESATDVEDAQTLARELLSDLAIRAQVRAMLSTLVDRP